jgi:sec-independent protein translocase protein TatA
MIGIKELIIILVVVLLIFGTKKLRNLGGDLGSSLKDFKKAMGEGESTDTREKDVNQPLDDKKEKKS